MFTTRVHCIVRCGRRCFLATLIALHVWIGLPGTAGAQLATRPSAPPATAPATTVLERNDHRLIEVGRTSNTSKLNYLRGQQRLGSVDGSLFIARGMTTLAIARGFTYMVMLEEQTAGEVYVYTIGFTNNPDADLAAEFGPQFKILDDSGRPKKLVSVETFKALLGSPPTTQP